MHELTAEIAEAHYGDARMAYAETVSSVGLQIHWNMSVALMAGHPCRNLFTFQPFRKNKMDHILVDRNMHCYQVTWAAKTHYMGRRYICQKLHADGNLDLKWHTVGIFYVVAMEKKPVKIEAKNIRGRGILDDKNRLFVWTRDMQDL